MSLMGIDVGTTGAKTGIFRDTGSLIASNYVEYDISRPAPGLNELDAPAVWEAIKRLITAAVSSAADALKKDPLRSIAVSSLGEAVVPVTRDRKILGPSILNSDSRGEEYLEGLAPSLDPERLYRVNGNVPGNHYSLTKLMWIRDHEPEIFRRAYKFLHWGPLVSFMLGAEPLTDYSLANRTLLFDIDEEDWSEELLSLSGIDPGKLSRTAPSGAPAGRVSGPVAKELGLPGGITVAAGAHDQCANALGCGVTAEGSALYGMGTVICVVPVFFGRKEPRVMIPRGLNTEHHAAPGRYVCFIYNQGGCLVKWFRDTFASAERSMDEKTGRDTYRRLFSRMPERPSTVLVLPHFDPTGPPEFISDSSGVIAGLKLNTGRGDILKGILEGSTYYLKECADGLSETGIRIKEYRAAGGGSKSDEWLQLSADIFGVPFFRMSFAEAGALGAAMLGGVGEGAFKSAEEAAGVMVKTERVFEPAGGKQSRYEDNYAKYKKMWPLMKEFLRSPG